MKVAVVQFKPVFRDKERNIEKIHDYLNTITADIVIFPELSTCGYYFLDKQEVAEVADEYNSPLITDIQEVASNKNQIIIVGFAEKAVEKFYNSAAILLPDSTKSKIYRKTHLFFKEHFCFEPGDTGFFIVEDIIKDIKIGTMICYDWRFPEAARTLALLGADLIVCPSNLITSVWQGVMPARAVENKVYLAIANRVGREARDEDELFFNGESVIYGYNGERLAKAGVEDEKVIYAEINPVLTRKKSFNEFNDVFMDRRPEMYKL